MYKFIFIFFVILFTSNAMATEWPEITTSNSINNPNELLIKDAATNYVAYKNYYNKYNNFAPNCFYKYLNEIHSRTAMLSHIEKSAPSYSYDTYIGYDLRPSKLPKTYELNRLYINESIYIWKLMLESADCVNFNKRMR